MNGLSSIHAGTDAIYTVSALTTSIKNTLETGFPYVWVKGQVVNLSRPSSGHIYFSLRDDYSSLPAVWFKRNQSAGEIFDPLTGEVFENGPRPSLAHVLENGQEIVCAGRLTVYAQRGSYQLVVELAQDIGIGRLQAEFERLKEKLHKAGYFSQERKRPIPQNPTKVAVITAPTGAAIHDFIRIANARGLGSTIKIYPALMQGDTAAQSILDQLSQILMDNWAEVVVIIRGGGSLEDLWAFNTEALVTAIKESPVPILAGIGHEIDFTLADMTADLRAATPSHAAQLLWNERKDFARQVEVYDQQIGRRIALCLQQMSDRYLSFRQRLSLQSPLRLLNNSFIRLASLSEQLDRRLARQFDAKEKTIGYVTAQLMKRPQSLSLKENRIEALQQRISLTMPGLLATKASQLMQYEQKVPYSFEKQLNRSQYAIERASLLLETYNPLMPLQRGYSLVYKADGAVVRSIHEIQQGDLLKIMFGEGEAEATVTSKKQK